MKRVGSSILAALLLLLLLPHCKDAETKRTAPPATSASAAESAPMALASSAAWRQVAAKPRPGELDDAYEALVDLKKMTPQSAAAVIGVLDKLAAQSATPQGLLAAGEIVAANESAGADPTWSGSGSAPAAAALHSGTMAVYRGLVARSAERDRADVDATAALIKAIRKVKLAPFPSTGGRTAEERDRSRLHIEARGVVGDEAFEAALKRAGL